MRVRSRGRTCPIRLRRINVPEAHKLSQKARLEYYKERDGSPINAQGIMGVTRHIIRWVFLDTRVLLAPIGCGPMLKPFMVPVRRQADPSPPTLKPQEFILVKGLLVL
jgi:hypothetical protein